MTISEQIRAAVQQALANGWTYDALSEATGVNKQTVYDFAKGETTINGRSLDRLADWFGMRLKARYRIPPAPKRRPPGRPPRPGNPARGSATARGRP